MKISAADVEVAVSSAQEEQRREAIHDDADRGDHDHRETRDRTRLDQALHGFEPDRAYRDEQDHRVQQGRQDGRAAIAIGEARARPLACQRARGPGDQQRRDIAEIVAGVGQQSHRMADQAVGSLHHDEADIEQRAHREGGVVASALVGVVVGVLVRWHRAGLWRHRPRRSKGAISPVVAIIAAMNQAPRP